MTRAKPRGPQHVGSGPHPLGDRHVDVFQNRRPRTQPGLIWNVAGMPSFTRSACSTLVMIAALEQHVRCLACSTRVSRLMKVVLPRRSGRSGHGARPFPQREGHVARACSAARKFLLSDCDLPAARS